MRGFPVSMVHRAIANPLVDRWLNTLRARAGTRLVRKRHAAGGVLRALHDRELLVLPFDQNSTRGLGVFVDFFGKPASTNSGIARLALARPARRSCRSSSCAKGGRLGTEFMSCPSCTYSVLVTSNPT